jgi:hypothetical protein
LFMKREHNSTLWDPWIGYGIPMLWGRLFYRPIRQTITHARVKMVGTDDPDQSVISPGNSFWGKWDNSARLSGSPGNVRRPNRYRPSSATVTDSATRRPIAPFLSAHKRAKGCSGFYLLRQLIGYHGCRLLPSVLCLLPCSSLNLFMKRETWHNSTLFSDG